MEIRIGYEIGIRCSADTALTCVLDVHPDRVPDLRSESPFLTSPAVPVSGYVDIYGNRCRRLVAPAGDITMTYGAIITDSGEWDAHSPQADEIPVNDLPAECLVYLLGSRYCETDCLSQYAWDRFGKIPPGWARVQAICDFVHGHIEFGYKFACSTRTAVEACNEKVGVCRDFAHLAITLCRAMNIPARYVNGYLGDIGVPPDPAPMDFSAWFEAYLGGRWFTFDARHNHPRIGRIVVARGRDATDVPLVQSFGQHQLQSFRVIAEEIPSAAEPSSLAANPPGAWNALKHPGDDKRVAAA